MDTTLLITGGTERSVCFIIEFGAKVFMDAHEPVTLEEGDRYPLAPPLISKRMPRWWNW
jgi:hypothetical protein